MKRAHLLAAIGAILFLVVSCQKTPTAEVSISQNELTASAMGGNISVNVSSNVDLTVRISVPWITQTGAPSGGGGLYSFNVERNSSYDPRTATITFSNGEQGVSETVNVIQSQQDAIIPGKLEYELFYEAQTFTLPISANVDYTVSLDGGDWIKSLGTRGLSSKQYQFSIAENTGKTPREAVLNISSERMKQSIKIVQLPTTHRPQSKSDWEESFKVTKDIAKASKTVIDKFPKDPVSGWNVEDIANNLSALDEVIDAVPDKSGKVVYVLQRDSSIIPVILEFDEIEEGFPSFDDDGSVPSTRSSFRATERMSVAPNGQEKKAILLAPYHHELLSIKIDHKHVKEELLSIGYKEENIKYYEDSKVKLEYVYGDNLATNDLVIINTHGGLWYYEFKKDPNTGDYLRDSNGYLIGEGDRHTVLCLGPIEDSDVDLFINTLEEGEREGFKRYIENGDDCKAIGKRWFEATTSELTNYPNSLILAFACYSFTYDDIYSVLTDKGASVYSGFINTVKKKETPKVINSLITCLTRGMSFNDSADYTFNDDTYDAKKIFRAKTKDGYSLKDVFLVDPRAYGLKEKLQGNDLVLEWEINIPSGLCLYDLIIDNKLVKAGLTTESSCSYTINESNLSPGDHNWYIVTHILDAKTRETLYYYSSESENFNVEASAIAVTGVKIRPSTVSIEPGETYQLTATVMPENASNKAVEWKSNHPELVSVDENGLITAIKRQAGTTVYITAKTVDGGKSSTCQVTVKEPSGGEVAVTGISLNQTSAELEVGKTLQLKSTITPSNATNKSVQWTSSNSAVASVDINGLVTAKAIGTAQITAKTEDGGKTATVSITVKKASEQNVPVTGVSINMSSLSLKVGESATLTTTIAPANATNKGVTWTTSMSSVATVTSDGVVTAKAAGTAVITAKTEDGGKTATCNVTVTYTPDPGGEVSVTQVTISPTSANMTVGDTKQFSVKIDPANATNQEVSWSSSDPSVASIDSKGLVTAKAEGRATITVTANDGGVSSKATVTVNNKTVPVTGVSVSPASLSMEIGESKALSVTVSPSDATDKTYTVTSDNTGVVDIDNSNNIVAKGAGTANVLITTSDGGFTAKCVVTVNKPQMTISVDPSSLAFGDVNVDESSTKTFSISNTGKAEVKVTGISVPEAYSVDETTPFTIAVGQSKTVTVTFTPTDGKDYNGNITITSDADSQPTVAVSGKGIKQSQETLEAVDLGLSVKWANMNLGATRSEEFGDYYAWGETEPKTSFSSDNYTKANLVVLKPEDDAAHVKLGGKWRMPTKDEVHELLYSDKCTYSFTTINENNCAIITSKVTGNSITLPAAGLNPGNVYNDSGFYWTSTLYEYSQSRAYHMYFVYGNIPSQEEWDYPRYIGMSIRPVYGDFVISVESVSLDKTELELSVGETASLTASIIPSNATNTSVTWSSSNTSVATVSSKGVVTGVSVGTATITVTTSDREKTTKCTVTVTKPAKSISVSPSSLAFGDVNVDETASKTFTISNTGKADVTVSGISVPGGFTSDANVPFSIAVGASKTVTVTFSPTEGKAYSGTITITSDADNIPTVALSGTSTPPVAVPEAVDLGLSVKWASFNLGASIPEDYGYIFAWGYTSPSDNTTTNDYKWSVGSNTFTKYYDSSFDGTDNKKVLDPEDDAAHVLLGNNWRIPTREEQDELLKNCERKWTTKNNAYGYLITGPNGNSIFLPARGDKDTGSPYGKYGGCYWSSSLYYLHAYAYCIFFQSSYSFSVDDQERYKCHAIRPVMDK